MTVSFEDLIQSRNQSRKLTHTTELTKDQAKPIVEKLQRRMTAVLSLRKHRKLKGSSLAYNLREELNLKTALADLTVCKSIYMNDNMLVTPRVKVLV